jgi:hypothetical protein
MRFFMHAALTALLLSFVATALGLTKTATICGCAIARWSAPRSSACRRRPAASCCPARHRRPPMPRWLN